MNQSTPGPATATVACSLGAFLVTKGSIILALVTLALFLESTDNAKNDIKE